MMNSSHIGKPFTKHFTKDLPSPNANHATHSPNTLTLTVTLPHRALEDLLRSYLWEHGEQGELGESISGIPENHPENLENLQGGGGHISLPRSPSPLPRSPSPLPRSSSLPEAWANILLGMSRQGPGVTGAISLTDLRCEHHI